MSMIPAYSDYINAVKNPQVSFANAQLQQGQPVQHGRRYVTVAGTTSLVFKYRAEEMLYAVRCYTQDVSPDMKKRYAALSAFRDSNPLPFMMDVSFESQGVLVDGKWYPICVMPWVEGERLDEYLDNHHRNPFAISRLSLQFLELIHTFQQAGCAHGNLAHDNMLITGEQIKLVGYDSFYTPDLSNSGLSALNVGHKNYQHPQRTAAVFDDSLDHFSSIVIYLSLKIIELDSSAHQHGAASMCFHRQDYLAPHTSENIKRLEKLGYAEAAATFRDICHNPPNKVPSLLDFIRNDPQLYMELPESIRQQVGQPLTDPPITLRVPEKPHPDNHNPSVAPYLFISHSSADNDFVDQLADTLHEMGYRTFVDHRNIVPGVSWMAEVETALQVTQAMILVMSPSSAESQNVEDEWVYYLDEQPHKPIFIAIKAPCKRSFRLAKLQYADFYSDTFEHGLENLLNGLHKLLA